MKVAKILMGVLYFLLWIFYFLITLDARGRYMRGRSVGKHCYAQSNGLTSTTYYFDSTKQPQREYLTWKEFWQGKLTA